MAPAASRAFSSTLPDSTKRRWASLYSRAAVLLPSPPVSSTATSYLARFSYDVLPVEPPAHAGLYPPRGRSGLQQRPQRAPLGAADARPWQRRGAAIRIAMLLFASWAMRAAFRRTSITPLPDQHRVRVSAAWGFRAYPLSRRARCLKRNNGDRASEPEIGRAHV